MNILIMLQVLTMTIKNFKTFWKPVRDQKRYTYTISYGYSCFNTSSYRRNSIRLTKNCKEYKIKNLCLAGGLL